MNAEDRVRQIVAWREAVSKLPDQHFFELMRMYLGEIKTPYNKQNLIERLSAFLRQPQARSHMVKLLDETDAAVLSAVRLLPHPTAEKITLLFAGTHTPRKIRETLLNLEERLLLFHVSGEDGHVLYGINPLLFDDLDGLTGSAALLSFRSFVPSPSSARAFLPALSPLFLASWFSFLNAETDLFKTDGSFKKRAETLVETTFPEFAGENGLYFAHELTKSLKNLQLIRSNGAGFTLEYERWLAFADLDSLVQISYITAASCGRFTRSSLSVLAHFVLELYASVPENCPFEILYRCAFLFREKEGGTPKKSKVAHIIQRLNGGEGAENEQSEPDLRLIIEKMILFGFLRENGGLVSPAEYPPTCAGSVRLDAGFTVTVLPSFPLKELLPLVRFLQITRFDTAACFEISRQSCLRSFSAGVQPAEIFDVLSSFTGRAVSQSVSFSVEEWFSAFSAVSLYKGYVLHVSEDRRHLIENNALFSKYLVKIIAPGIYLLNFTEDDEAALFIKKSGLPSGGFVSNVARNAIQQSFLSVQVPPRCAPVPPEPPVFPAEQEDLRLSLYEELDRRGFTKEETDALKSRIARKIIVLPEQLRAESVRFEKTEAKGIDFLGKIQIIESAVSSDTFVELSYEDASADSRQVRVFTGLPISLEKHDGDAVVKIKIQGSEHVEILSIGKASAVRRIRGSIFK